MPRTYSQDEIDGALIAYWLEGEHAERAAKHVEPSENTIREWATRTHRGRYHELVERNAPLLDKQLLRKQEAIQLEALETITLAIRQTKQQIEAGRHRNPDQAAQRLAVAMGIITDKWLLLQGRPTQINQPAEADAHLRALAHRFPWLVVDSDAEEVHAAKQLPDAT